MVPTVKHPAEASLFSCLIQVGIGHWFHCFFEITHGGLRIVEVQVLWIAEARQQHLFDVVVGMSGCLG